MKINCIPNKILKTINIDCCEKMVDDDDNNNKSEIFLQNDRCIRIITRFINIKILVQ